MTQQTIWKVNEPFLADAGDIITEMYEQGFKAKLVIFDLPYNSTDQEWDGNFYWNAEIHDKIQDVADIVIIVPGINQIEDFIKRTNMNYKWIICCYLRNGRARGALAFSRLLLGIIYTKEASIFCQRNDFFEVIINTNETLWYPKAQKPLKWIRYLIDIFTEPNDLVLDLFAGGFTTAAAATIEKRQWICSDISPDSIEIGKRRLFETKQYITAQKKQTNLADFF